MGTLREFIKMPNKKSTIWWIKFYWGHILDAIYSPKKPKYVDDSWKGVKIATTVIPMGWSSENAFAFLNSEYNKEKEPRKMKRFLD